LTNKKSNKILYQFIKLGISIALLYYLVEIVSYQQIYTAFIESNKIFIFSVFFLMFLNIYLQFLKWRVVCRSLLKIHDNKKILKSLFYGFSAGIITPVRVGEYLGRKLAFDETSLVKVTLSTIVEKFASLFIVLIVGGITSMIFLIHHYSLFYALPIFLLIIGIVVLALMLLNGYNFSTDIFDKLTHKYEFFKNLKLELIYLKNLDRSTAVLLFRYSILFFVIVILQYALLAKAFYQNGDILILLGAGSIILFVKSFLSFLSFADLGIRETTSVFLLDKIGYTGAVGFNSAIFLFVFNLLIPSVVGMFLLLKYEKRKN
jgi:uncharacterized membrane protein YbhN (UPF0104 family)